MRTLILDGLFINKELENVFGGRSSLSIIYEKAKKNKFDRYILLNNGSITNIPEGIKSIELCDITPFSILNAVLSESRNTEHIAVFDAGNPFYDHEFIEKMFVRHEDYFADYTYAIGYPEGLTPTLLRKEVLKEFIKLVEDDEDVRKDYLFYTLSKDINSFDIETFLSPRDLRIQRIKFGLNDAGEELFTKRSFDKFKSDFSVDLITEYFFNNPDELYTLPYMLDLDITDSSPVKSIYYPEVRDGGKEMSFAAIRKIISSMKEMNGDFHLLLGGAGDPAVHVNFFEILEFISAAQIDCVIETTGSLIDESFPGKTGKVDRKKIVFVVKLDCYDETTYNIIHPGGSFSKAKKAVSILRDAGFKVYKLIVRMNENEIEIEKYIRNKEADDLIIRKFSNYCLNLKDRKVVDLSPLERIPCFHLRREIHVNPDETVSFCMYKQDVIIGDLKKENMNVIVDRLRGAYRENARSEYRDFCVNCDDYYIFNF